MRESTGQPAPRCRPRAGVTIMMAAALVITACAGSLHKYRAGLPGAGAGSGGSSSEDAAAPVEASVAGAEDAVATGGPVDLAGGAAPSGGLSSGARGGAAAPHTTGTGAAHVAAVGAGASGAGAPGAGPAPGGNAAPASGSESDASAPPAGAGGSVPPGPGTTTGITRDAITVGLFYPKTGAYTAILRNTPAVFEAAFAEAGPIHGRKVVLKTYDDGTANASTIQVEEKRAKDEVFMLVGGVSEAMVVLAPLAEQHRVPLVVGNIDEKVALPLTWAFPILAYLAHQAKLLPAFVKNILGAADKRIGIVYEGTSTAKAAKEAFKVKAAEAGLQVVFEQPIAQNQSTCANEVSNLQAKQVELVFMMNGPLGAICMLRDARALAYRPMWTGVGASWNLNVVASATGGAAEGIRTLGTVTTLETPEGRHFAELMRKKAPNTGADEDDIMLIGYSMARTLLEALRLMGPNPTREAFVQTMETKMNGYDSGYLPPPTFGPRNRSGPLSVSVTACCSDGRWTTPQIGWRPGF